MTFHLASSIIFFIASFLCAALGIAFFTLAEQKFLGYIQLRKGPNKVGLAGLPQPFADVIKLFTKEQAAPSQSNFSAFYFAPLLSLILALALWSLYPHHNPTYFFTWGALYFLCISSMNVYGTLIAGWASNSKYALLGAIRAVAQTISYEVSMALILIAPLFVSHTIEISKISISSFWSIGCLFPLFFIWVISTLAETNRAPFDFAEGESEIVSGFNIEYRSAPFAFIFIAEYINILVISLFTATFFIPRFGSPLIQSLETVCISFMFIWARGSLPRIRYDRLMSLAWKTYLPFVLVSLIIVSPLTNLM